MLVAEEKQGVISEQICDHCGEQCIGDYPKEGEYNFCCSGCHLVWNILHENGLSDYYDIEEIPGLTFKRKDSNYYDYLDEPEIVKRLISFSAGDTKTIFVDIPQIHCSSCIWLLERLHVLQKGVKNVRVNFLQKKATIVFDEREVSLREIAELLDKIGYTPSFSLEHKEFHKPAQKDKSIIYKIGVAGFCFGNIMLLSFPDYLGIGASRFASFFGVLNIVLALPVLLYSASDYLSSAYRSLKVKRIGIDVPIAIGILTLFIRSIYEIVVLNSEGYLDSLAGFVFFLLIGKWIQQRTFSGISFDRGFRSFYPIAVKYWTGENWMSKSIDLLKRKDRILIRNGEIIPCDGFIANGKGAVDYSFVTGESDPISLSKGMAVSSGGKLINSSFEIEVEKEVDQGQLTQLWNDDIFNKRDQNRESHLLNIIGKYFTIVILVIAALSLIFWLQYDTAIAFNSFTSVLIIACPCVLALSIPFLYGSAIRRLADSSIFCRNVFTIIDFNEIDTIVFDKTGTLTDTKKAKVEFVGPKLSGNELSIIKSLTQYSNHKLSELIYLYCGQIKLLPVESFEEISGHGIMGTVNGQNIRIGSEEYILHSATKPTKSRTYVEIDDEVIGHFEFEHSIRFGLPEMINELESEKIEMAVLSGDNASDKEKISELFPNNSDILFNQSPLHKLEYIKLLQKSGRKVMMIGDGLNDAGALKQSNVGVVVSSDENNFTPASDLIIHHDKLRHIPNILSFSKGLRNALFGAFTLALLYNSIGLGFAVSGNLTPVVAAILMPLSSLSIMLYGVSMSWILIRQSIDVKTDKA